MDDISTSAIRLSGLAAIIAGLMYMVTQIVHPVEHDLEAIASNAWAVAHYFSFAFGIFAILGMVGIYVKQAKEAGWLGLAGFVLFMGALIFIASFGFLEAFVMPFLVDEAPQYVETVYEIFDGGSGPGAIGAMYNLNALLYLGGGILFGIATVRANVFPRWAALVFTVGSLGSLAGAISEGAGRASTFVLGAGLVSLGVILLLENRSDS